MLLTWSYEIIPLYGHVCFKETVTATTEETPAPAPVPTEGEGEVAAPAPDAEKPPSPVEAAQGEQQAEAIGETQEEKQPEPAGNKYSLWYALRRLCPTPATCAKALITACVSVHASLFAFKVPNSYSFCHWPEKAMNTCSEWITK